MIATSAFRAVRGGRDALRIFNSGTGRPEVRSSTALLTSTFSRYDPPTLSKKGNVIPTPLVPSSSSQSATRIPKWRPSLLFVKKNEAKRPSQAGAQYERSKTRRILAFSLDRKNPCKSSSRIQMSFNTSKEELCLTVPIHQRCSHDGNQLTKSANYCDRQYEAHYCCI